VSPHLVRLRPFNAGSCPSVLSFDFSEFKRGIGRTINSPEFFPRGAIIELNICVAFFHEPTTITSAELRVEPTPAVHLTRATSPLGTVHYRALVAWECF